ncbi:hypothetical protein JCM5353_007108 [Sporobolomyces roseus]
MSYRQDRRDYHDNRDYRAPPQGRRQQLNYDDLDGDSSALPPPRRDNYSNRNDERDDRGGYNQRGFDRGGGRGGGGGYERRRSRSPQRTTSRREDDYSNQRDRGELLLYRSRSSQIGDVDEPPPNSPLIDSRRSRSPPPHPVRSRRSPSPSSSRRRHSPSPPPRSSRRERDENGRSPPPSPRRNRSRSRSRSVVEEAAEVEEQDIAALMGFGGFGTTQGKAHEGELSGAQVKRERAHRQYMNRKGGFNRPLDKIK